MRAHGLARTHTTFDQIGDMVSIAMPIACKGASFLGRCPGLRQSVDAPAGPRLTRQDWHSCLFGCHKIGDVTPSGSGDEQAFARRWPDVPSERQRFDETLRAEHWRGAGLVGEVMHRFFDCAWFADCSR